jgi:hypothetical protein
MVSLNALLATTEPSGEVQEPEHRRTRRDWVRGEVRCLMCGRLIGRLLGARGADQSRNRTSGGPISFFAYRPSDPSRPVVAFTPLIRLRCAECGGTGALDEVEFFSTFDEVPIRPEHDETGRRGPGRPPRQVIRAHPAPGGVALALAALADGA